MTNKKNAESRIYAILLAVSIVVTCIVAFLLVSESWRGGRFVLELAAIVLAEAITFY